MQYLKFLKNRILQTILVLILFGMTANKLPLEILRALFTCSVFIKDILMLILPIVVCFFIAASLSKFEKKAPLFILLLITFEGCSNFIGVWYAYIIGGKICDHVTNINIIQENLHSLIPYFHLSTFWPAWWSVSKGTLVGLFLGLLCSHAKLHTLRNFVFFSKSIFEFMLTKIFARLIPLFVLGFVANIYALDLLEKVFLEFLGTITWILLAVFVYLLILYLIAAKLNFSTAIKSMLNLLPAGFIALTSGCSISTIPFTIKGTIKNLRNPEFAQMVIPATTNIQQIGDCIINIILCLVIIKSFGHQLPNLHSWLQFSIAFTLARYATAAVLGGAIFIMLPIYIAYLGFTGEMTAMILAFNIILDPIVTSSNVMANAALCNILENIWNKIVTIPLQNMKNIFFKIRNGKARMIDL